MIFVLLCQTYITMTVGRSIRCLFSHKKERNNAICSNRLYCNEIFSICLPPDDFLNTCVHIREHKFIPSLGWGLCHERFGRIEFFSDSKKYTVFKYKRKYCVSAILLLPPSQNPKGTISLMSSNRLKSM